jgi:hypothetical protein
MNLKAVSIKTRVRADLLMRSGGRCPDACIDSMKGQVTADID